MATERGQWADGRVSDRPGGGGGRYLSYAHNGVCQNTPSRRTPQGGKCAYTGRELVPGTNASLDHKIPKALGGTNDLENLQWVETNVNRAKNALAEDEFLSMCRAVVQHMERNQRAVRPL